MNAAGLMAIAYDVKASKNLSHKYTQDHPDWRVDWKRESHEIIRQETVEICEYFDVNPYGLISSGAMLMATEDGESLVKDLCEAGIPATVIGKAVAGNDRVIIREDERRFLEPPKTDELYKVLG